MTPQTLEGQRERRTKGEAAEGHRLPARLLGDSTMHDRMDWCHSELVLAKLDPIEMHSVSKVIARAVALVALYTKERRRPQ